MGGDHRHIILVDKAITSLLTCLCCLLFALPGCEPASHTRLEVDPGILLEPAQQQQLKDYLRALQAASVRLTYHPQIGTFMRSFTDCPTLYAQSDSLRIAHLHKLSKVNFDCTATYDEGNILVILWSEGTRVTEFTFPRNIDLEQPETYYRFDPDF